jgi:hypothetical protein
MITYQFLAYPQLKPIPTKTPTKHNSQSLSIIQSLKYLSFNPQTNKLTSNKSLTPTNLPLKPIIQLNSNPSNPFSTLILQAPNNTKTKNPLQGLSPINKNPLTITTNNPSNLTPCLSKSHNLTPIRSPSQVASDSFKAVPLPLPDCL